MLYNDDFLHKLNKPMMMADDDDDDDLLDEELDNDKDDDDSDNGSVSSSKVESSADSTPRNSTGITRSAGAFGAVSFMGIIPITLLILYMLKGGGLSTSAFIFLLSFFIGLIISAWTFVYYRSAPQSFNRFDVHAFFKWSEIAVISVVLLVVSFLNISKLSSGGFLVLSANSTIEAKTPAPIFAPKPPANSFENEEVLYEAPEYSNIKKEVAKRPVVAKPVTKRVTYRKQRAARVAPVAMPLDKNISKVKADRVEKITSVLTHEDEEGMSTTTGRTLDDVVDDAVSIAEISVNNYGKKSGGSSGSMTSVNVETSPFVDSAFLGGILCASLGYAFSLAIAGAILALLRKFNNPFAAKTKELINEETGEITLETEAQSALNKILDIVFRFFIGFNVGGTVGFVLGLIITIPLYFMFWETSQTDQVVSSILMTMGVVKNPDLAYSTGLIVSGIMVPIIMLVVGKSSPAGVSITEEKVRQIYSIPVTINKASTDMTSIPEPAIISFDLDDQEESTRDGLIVDDFSDDTKESLTGDLLSEFGIEVESVFGLKVNLPAKTNGNGNGDKMSSYEKQKVNSILENSLGELGNVTVQVSAELGKATIMLTDWLNLSEGMLIELDKPVSEEIDILINDVCKGKGKLTVENNHLSVKVSKSNFSQSLN